MARRRIKHTSQNIAASQSVFRFTAAPLTAALQSIDGPAINQNSRISHKRHTQFKLGPYAWNPSCIAASMLSTCLIEFIRRSSLHKQANFQKPPIRPGKLALTGKHNPRRTGKFCGTPTEIYFADSFRDKISGRVHVRRLAGMATLSLLPPAHHSCHLAFHCIYRGNHKVGQ